MHHVRQHWPCWCGYSPCDIPVHRRTVSCLLPGLCMWPAETQVLLIHLMQKIIINMWHGTHTSCLQQLLFSITKPSCSSGKTREKLEKGKATGILIKEVAPASKVIQQHSTRLYRLCSVPPVLWPGTLPGHTYLTWATGRFSTGSNWLGEAALGSSGWGPCQGSHSPGWSAADQARHQPVGDDTSLAVGNSVCAELECWLTQALRPTVTRSADGDDTTIRWHGCQKNEASCKGPWTDSKPSKFPASKGVIQLFWGLTHMCCTRGWLLTDHTTCTLTVTVRKKSGSVGLYLSLLRLPQTGHQPQTHHHLLLWLIPSQLHLDGTE